MCGILGILGRPDPDVLGAMTASLTHRGPDAQGAWSDPEAGVVLGHLRLAILDLSPAGAQPMTSVCGRYVIVFNGEIYNHLVLRAELEAELEAQQVQLQTQSQTGLQAGSQAGLQTEFEQPGGKAPDWRGHSDTETLLALIVAVGLEAALRRVRGMFALALWDRQAGALLLARDRMGEKPLYVAERPGAGWAFASELRAFHHLTDMPVRLDRGAVAAFLSLGYVPDDSCILAGVRKVPPGHIWRLSANGPATAPAPYETFDDLRQQGATDPAPASPERAIETVLAEVIDQQMLSDVPLGCFLSGGVDSSLVASLMQSGRATQVRTFSIGFDVARFNEAPHAAAVARHLGTAHIEFILSEAEALAVVPDLAEIYDEPFADSSQIPVVLLCREARRAVTVALSGDGGDEVFGGYNRHVLGPRIWAGAARVPRSLRAPVMGLLAHAGGLAAREDGALRAIARRLKLPVTAIDKIAHLGPALGRARSIADLYHHFVTTFPDLSVILHDAPPAAGTQDPLADGAAAALWMMARDSVTYLPGDILVKVDRAAMHASLETRAPFLDARVVRAAWSLPLEAKIHGGRGKTVLRDILARHVPRPVTDRPKQGFAVPVDRWLRGALRGWAGELLDQDALIRLAGLRGDALAGLWREHLAGQANHGQKLWTVLMLLAWLSRMRPYLETDESIA